MFESFRGQNSKMIQAELENSFIKKISCYCKHNLSVLLQEEDSLFVQRTNASQLPMSHEGLVTLHLYFN